MVDDNDKDGVIKVYMKSVNGVYSQSQVVENFGWPSKQGSRVANIYVYGERLITRSKSCTFWPPNEDHGIGDYMFVIFQNS